jgi:hypothetical protein
MRCAERIVAALVTAALLTVVVVGCGGGGSDSSSGSKSPEGSTSKSSKKSEGSEPQPTAEPKSPPSVEFVGKGENGQLATLGKVASTAEREAASRALEESFQARAASDWAGQCSTLAAEVIKQIEKTATVLGASPGCVKALEKQAEPTPPSALANPMTGPIDVLRTNLGVQAFAFFHGTENKDYVVPLTKEGGQWKVAALTTQEVP